MTLTCHNCKKPGHKTKECKQVMETSNKSTNMEDGKRKWCLYHSSNGSLNKDCCQHQSESANFDRKKRWCTYHNSASHSNIECFHQRGSKFDSSSVHGKNSGNKKPPLLIVLLLTAMRNFSVDVKGKIVLIKVMTSRIPHHLTLGLHLHCVIPLYLKKVTASNSW